MLQFRQNPTLDAELKVYCALRRQPCRPKNGEAKGSYGEARWVGERWKVLNGSNLSTSWKQSLLQQMHVHRLSSIRRSINKRWWRPQSSTALLWLVEMLREAKKKMKPEVELCRTDFQSSALQFLRMVNGRTAEYRCRLPHTIYISIFVSTALWHVTIDIQPAANYTIHWKRPTAAAGSCQLTCRVRHALFVMESRGNWSIFKWL
jgi:hypothetical protein